MPRLTTSAMPQLVKGAQVLLGEASPSLVVRRRPEIAGQAAGHALTAIVDLDQLLPAVIAAIHVATVACGYVRMRGVGFGRRPLHPRREHEIMPVSARGPHGVYHVAIRPFLVFLGLWRTPLRPERPEPPARGLHHDRQHRRADTHSLSRFIDAVGRRTGGSSGRFWASTLSAYNTQPLASSGLLASSWASCNFSMSAAACGRRCSWRYTLPAPWP